MDDHVDGVFGDTRWICFERFLASFLWENAGGFSDLAKGDETFVIRQEAKGRQQVSAAIRSAVLGAASGIQKAVMRQLGNYFIQNAGARLTKKLMRAIWEEFFIAMMNVHDEIDCPADVPVDYRLVKKTVQKFIEKYREQFEGLSMDWNKTETWADK